MRPCFTVQRAAEQAMPADTMELALPGHGCRPNSMDSDASMKGSSCKGSGQARKAPTNRSFTVQKAAEQALPADTMELALPGHGCRPLGGMTPKAAQSEEHTSE